jgi:hypothetical protein
VKKLISSLFLCVALLEVHGQVNLVPNPSFEETLVCPFGIGDLTPLVGWSSFGNTPDCFHECSQSTINIPYSAFGYQYAHSGQSMAGIISYVWEQDPGWPNYREYLGVELTSSLVIGERYYTSFFINCAGYFPGKQHIGANKIGSRFSTFQYDFNQPTVPDNFSQIHTDSILTDTVNWYRVTGSFIADSAYQFLIIGNFYDYLQTDTIIFGGEPFGGSVAYYYIDDVCVSTDSLYNENWVGLTENISFNENQISIFPNPVNDILQIESEKPLEKVTVYNSFGQLIFTKENFPNDDYNLNLEQIDAGIYFVKIRTQTSEVVQKIAVN